MHAQRFSIVLTSGNGNGKKLMNAYRGRVRTRCQFAH